MKTLSADCEDLIHNYSHQLLVSRLNSDVKKKFASFQKMISEYMVDLRSDWCPTKVALTDWPKLEQEFMYRWPYTILHGRP